MLVCMMNRCGEAISVRAQSLIPPQKSSMSLQKSPMSHNRRTLHHFKRALYISKRALYLLCLSLYIDGKCGDVTCSAATTSAPYTSTPLPTTTAGHPTWGNRYIDPRNSSSKDMLRYIYIYTYTCVVYVNPHFLDDSMNMYCVCAREDMDSH